MDARVQLRVQRYGWDAACSHYEAGWSVQLRPAHETLLQLADVREGQRVIETACGTGLVTRRLAAAVGPAGYVLATDLSQKMVDDVANRHSVGPRSNVEARRMGAEALAVEDGSFDLAISALGLMYVPDPSAAVSEMVRVVRPGGTATATVWGERKKCGWAEVFPIVDARVASEVCPLFFGTGGPGVLAAIFRAAGLEYIEERRQSEILGFDTDEEVVTSVLLGGPVALAIKRFSQEVWQDVRGEFLASVSGYSLPTGGYQIPGEFVTVRGSRQ